MLDSSYPFYFVMNEKGDADNGILTVKLYRFISTISNITFFVRVEIYQNHVYAVKFYTKNSRHSKNKYSLMTNTNEPRFIIHTCIYIMLSIYKNDKMASFGFIGASSINEDSTYCTKRYRVYSKIVATYFSDENFYHKENKNKSAYMLINNKTLANNPKLIEDIESFFIEQYDYFN